MNDISPKDMTEDNFALWRRHPATIAFMQYLTDYSEALIVAHVALWKVGKLETDTDAEARGRVQALEEIVGLMHTHIKDFYEPKDEAIDEGQDS